MRRQVDATGITSFDRYRNMLSCHAVALCSRHVLGGFWPYADRGPARSSRERSGPIDHRHRNSDQRQPHELVILDLSGKSQKLAGEVHHEVQQDRSERAAARVVVDPCHDHGARQEARSHGDPEPR